MLRKTIMLFRLVFACFSFSNKAPDTIGSAHRKAAEELIETINDFVLAEVLNK